MELNIYSGAAIFILGCFIGLFARIIKERNIKKNKLKHLS